MNKNLYSTGVYIKKNQSYHLEDSNFKWTNFKNILINSNFIFNKINSVIDVGCGAGQILANAKKSKFFNLECNFEGYDINPDAIDLAKKNNKDIGFFNSDYLSDNNHIKYDKKLILAADVFEHLQNPYEFLKKLKNKGSFFLFNIPLEISLLSMIRKKNIYKNSFDQVGHLHYYNHRTALLILKNCGYELIKFSLVNNRFFEIKENKNFKKILLYLPQYILELFSKNLSASLFGGYSLVVLAK